MSTLPRKPRIPLGRGGDCPECTGGVAEISAIQVLRREHYVGWNIGIGIVRVTERSNGLRCSVLRVLGKVRRALYVTHFY